jgi:hypothetical protein
MGFGSCLLFCWFFPFLYEELVISEFKAYFYEYGIGASKWEHAVFGEIFWQVDQEFAVFSSEQASSPFVNHFVYTSLKSIVQVCRE